MSMRKRAGFLSPDRISELVWDSESEETRSSNNCIIYLGNRILCTFRQALKYICFSYCSLDGLISCRDSRFLLVKDKLEMMAQVSRLEQQSLGLFSDAAKMSHVKCERCEEKSC